MTIAVKLLNDQIKRISETNTLLDMLLEFEKALDSMDMYAFANWDQGEILTGPDLDRHFVTVQLMYPGKQMPDPEGAKRLLARECLVKYRKDTLLSPRKVRNFDDLMVDIRSDGSTRYKAKTDAKPIWVLEIRMPRRYVDEFDTDRVALDVGAYVDLEDAGADAQLQVADQSTDQIPADVTAGVM